MSNAIPFYIHSTHCQYKDDPLRNAVVVKEHVYHKGVDGKEPYWTQRLKIMRDPEREFFVTLPQFRDHKYKKEFETLDKLERFRCKDSELHDKVAMALGYQPWQVKYQSVRQLCESPYIYGADIDTETLIRQEYTMHKPEDINPEITVGAFDIETEVVGEKRINVITFIHEHKIYTAALKEFCRIYNKATDSFTPASEEDCLKVIDEIVGSEFTKHNFTLEFKICDTELSLIKWIFSKIHECKTDFIGIWNMGFDIPKVMDRLEKLGVNPADVFCPPCLPREYRYCRFKEDKSKMAEHIADKWHWLHCTGFSQFVDSMCLYGRLRKADGRDVSYSLDYISNKELGQGKLHLGEVTNHRYSQTYEFLKYIAYNINDVLIMMLMEFKNHDINTLCGLTMYSHLSNFNKQTVMVRDNDYVYAREKGAITAAACTEMFTEYDKIMPKAGGTVLPPEKAVGVGSNIVKYSNDPTQVVLFVNDLDEKSMYPCTIRAFNISKETFYGTVLEVNGYSKEAVEVFGSTLNNPDVSAVQLGTTFFGLPSYDTILDEFDKIKDD